MAFHVPESARIKNHPFLASDDSDGNNGAFIIESPEPGWKLALVCSDEEWEHVSVHAFKDGGNKQRIPTWKEMSHVKDLCWDNEDIVIQFHPPKSKYVNIHNNVLHLWRPLKFEIPLPPIEFV
jgi:hypothetical protein